MNNYDALIQSNAETRKFFIGLRKICIVLIIGFVLTMIAEIGFSIVMPWSLYTLKGIGGLAIAIAVISFIIMLLNDHEFKLKRQKKDKEDADKWNNIS